MNNFEKLIGRKFKRNKYGLSSWTDTITKVRYKSHLIDRELEKIKPFVMGTLSKKYYNLNEIVIY